MNKNVFKYFVDLEKSNLKTDSIGNLIISEDKIKELDIINNRVYECQLNDHIFYAKEFESPNSIISIASSAMYNELDILTPPEVPIRTTLPSCKTRNKPFTFTQDVSRLLGLYCTIAEHIDEYYYLSDYSVQHNNKWEILYNKNLKDCFLSFMTEECFDDLISLYLIDELRTDRDRHNENLFLYRQKPYGKYEGIIPIDLERVEILEYNIFDSVNFQDFITRKYRSYTPVGNSDIKSYNDRIQDILYLIQDDILSKKQIDLLKKATSYDLPKTIRDTCERYNFEHCLDRAYSPIAHLWEYNHKQLDKELQV